MNFHIRPAFQYRFRPPGQPIAGPVRYACGPSSLGMLLVARSQDGLCAILVNDDKNLLFAALRAALPAATLVAASGDLQHELEQATLCVDGHQTDGSLTLDLGGTAFQQRVWQALLAIPAGQTRSYGDLAASLSLAPRAARAIGGACAANLLAVAIPCHRVVRRDGSIASYRWGQDRKRALLLREKTSLQK